MLRASTFFTHVFEVVTGRKKDLMTISDSISNKSGLTQYEQPSYRTLYDQYLVS